MTFWALILMVFLLTAAVVYFFLFEQVRRTLQGWFRHESSIAQTLDNLFIDRSKQLARLLMPISLVGMTLTGFFLPGGQTGFDRFLLDNAVSLNKHAYYEQTLLFLAGLPKRKSALLHNELGVAYWGLGDLEDAIKNVRTAVNIYPSYAQAYANLAYLYSVKGRHSDAEFARKRAEGLAKLPLDEALIYGGVDDTPLILRLVFASVFAWFGFKLPGWILSYLRKRRIRKFDKQLPDGLGMISSALRAGLSLPHAMEVVVNRMRPPISQEFGLVLKQYRLGTSIEDAVVGLTKQMDTEDTQMLISTIRMLTKTGGDITQGLENVAYVIRERWRIKEKINTMTSEGKTQAVIMGAIPIVVGFMLNKFLPDTFSLMYTTTLGWVILLLMTIWGGIGVFLMWKMVQVKI